MVRLFLSSRIFAATLPGNLLLWLPPVVQVVSSIEGK